MRKIVVESHNPNWKYEFQKLKKLYQNTLSDIVVQIEHVGSTSVPGLSAKPILDIDIIVENKKDLEKVIDKLKSIGYIHMGNLGVEGREAFKYDEIEYQEYMEHHLYAGLKNSQGFNNHLNLREYLLNHPDGVIKYGELKAELAEKYPYDIDSYIEGKTKLITEYLEKMGLDKKTLDEITLVNKKDC